MKMKKMTCENCGECEQCEELNKGAIAEDIIKPFVRKNFISWTKPEKDDNGWDFLFEFKENKQRRKAFIQVKGFSGDIKDYKGQAISLTNIRTMIEDDQPWFIFFVNVDTNEIHIIFFDEVLIKKGIKRIKDKENEYANKSEYLSLQDYAMQINPNTIKNQVVKINIDIKDLKEILLTYLPCDYRDYSVYKKDILKKCYYYVTDHDLFNRYFNSLNIEFKEINEDMFNEKYLAKTKYIQFVEKDKYLPLNLKVNISRDNNSDIINFKSKIMNLSILKEQNELRIDFNQEQLISDKFYISISDLINELKILDLIMNKKFSLKIGNETINHFIEKTSNDFFINIIEKLNDLKLLIEDSEMDITEPLNSADLFGREFYKVISQYKELLSERKAIKIMDVTHTANIKSDLKDYSLVFPICIRFKNIDFLIYMIIEGEGSIEYNIGKNELNVITKDSFIHTTTCYQSNISESIYDIVNKDINTRKILFELINKYNNRNVIGFEVFLKK